MNKLILDYYGFSSVPFSKGIDTKDIFPTAAHSQALGMMGLAAGKEDVVLLTGEIGTPLQLFEPFPIENPVRPGG